MTHGPSGQRTAIVTARHAASPPLWPGEWRATASQWGWATAGDVSFRQVGGRAVALARGSRRPAPLVVPATQFGCTSGI